MPPNIKLITVQLPLKTNWIAKHKMFEYSNNGYFPITNKHIYTK